jgi:phospholipase/lecithinase/hemolysin
VVSTDSYGLPKYDLATCVGTHLPSGWEQHVFSDHFHGTPRVNQLLADDVLKALYQKGWR